MKNKKFLLGMLVLALAFGMTVIGCDEPEDPDNPLKGSWSGSYTEKDKDEVEAKVTITDTAWTLTVGEGDSEKTLNSGTYTWSKIAGVPTAELKVETDQGNIPIGKGTVLAGGLTLTFTLGKAPGNGYFKRVKGDPLAGTWNGNYTLSDGDEASATIVFTTNASDATKGTWTLTCGTITQNGSYTKSSLGLTANLTITTTELGSVPVGTAISNPANGNLTVTITIGVATGKGTFSR